MIPFKDLLGIIKKSCNVIENESAAPDDISSRFHFSVDCKRMEKMLKAKKVDYHVLACATKLESFVPSIIDIHFLSQFTRDSKELSQILNGYTEIVLFTLYTDTDINGKIEIRNNSEDQEPMSAHELFVACNGTDDEDDDQQGVALDIASCIKKETPNYSILIYRSFSTRRDRYIYNVKFVSNIAMTKYYKASLGQKVIEAPDEDEENTDGKLE